MRLRLPRRVGWKVGSLGLVLAILLPAQLLLGFGRPEPIERPEQPVDVGVGPPLADALPLVPTRRPSPRPTPTPSPTPDPVPDGPMMFSGLGAWIDLFDYDALDLDTVIADLRARGVATLYLQTGRYNSDTQVDPRVGPWLVAAQRADIEVVAWYLPGYRRMGKEVRRTVAAARYGFEGHRFDAVGVDIEYKGEVRHVPTWNARVVEHLRRVRAELGSDYPLASIVPPPLQMDVAPQRWAGFPWRGIAQHSDVIMLMSYWSYRNCPDVPDHCAYPFTRKNVEITRELTGAPELPVHTIGGVGDRITVREVADFVRGALDAEAFGASLYDYRVTRPAYWQHLERLRALPPSG